MAGRIDLTLRALEGHSAKGPQGPLTYFDLMRWRRRPLGHDVPVRPKAFGERLRHCRLELGLSQAEAGKRIGVGHATIYRWERGKNSPPRGFRAAVIQFLGFMPPELRA